MTREQMSSADTAWLHMDRPTNRMVVSALMWFDQPLDWSRVEERLDRRLVAEFPRFRQRVVDSSLPLDRPWWEEDPGFELEAHLHHTSLPAPGDQGMLRGFVERTMTTSLDRSRALWEVHLIDGFGSGCALFFRIHHCIADGVALARVMLSLTDDGPDAGLAPSRAGGHGAGALDRLSRPAARTLATTRTLAEAVWNESTRVVAHPSELTSFAAAGRTDAKTLAKLLLTGPDVDTVLKGELGIARRVAWSAPLRLDGLKEVGHGFGGTVNDVVLTAVAGALRVYLKEHRGPVDEVRAIVPFNLRSLDEPLPRTLGNQFGLVLVPLPVGIDSRRERLAEVKREMDAIKRSPEGAFSYGILGAIGLTPVQIQNLVIGQFAARGTLVITNVAGPPQPLHFAGAPMRGAVFWAPCAAEVGMSVSIFSYAGEVRLGLAVDAGLVPEPQRIVNAFNAEYRELAALAGIPVATGQQGPYACSHGSQKATPASFSGAGP
jgi:diacylglycerol O-acyltransferase / wax synthase